MDMAVMQLQAQEKEQSKQRYISLLDLRNDMDMRNGNNIR